MIHPLADCQSKLIGDGTTISVSYTHLDVYKRQIYARKIKIEKEEITITDIKVEGRDMLTPITTTTACI